MSFYIQKRFASIPFNWHSDISKGDGIIIDWTFITDLTTRLSVALALGGLIGLEREYRAKQAGFRTHFLVTVGSALFCIVSQFGFGTEIKDASRVAAQVVSGIGFLGAGTIIFYKNVVRRLKDRRTPSGESYEASLELKVKRGSHNERLIEYMEEFDDVTISSIE